MKTMKWLLKREFWEHKGTFFWTPLIVSGVMIFFLVLTLIFGNNLNSMQISYVENGQQSPTLDTGANGWNAFAEKFAQGVGNHYMLFATPLFAILGFVIFFYCLNSLYDDRRDRSILFWKSLPISDRDTVLSKLIMAVVVAPILFTVIASILSLAAVLLGGVAFLTKGQNIFTTVLTSPEFYLAPLRLLAILPVYALWALPTVGWLLMVSAWARSKVFLWAAGVPVLSIVLVWWANGLSGIGWNANWYAKNIVGRLLLSVFPGGWTNLALKQAGSSAQFDGDSTSGVVHLFREAMALLGSANLWIGAIAGASMIAVSIYLRRWRDE